MPNKIKHLEMIQAVIDRMASNSFKLKGWAVTLVTAIFTLVAKDVDKIYSIIVFIPIIIFWGLDAYYLRQERLYRDLYKKVRSTEESKIDFSLTATKQEYGNDKTDFWSCMLSATEIWFYFPLAVVCAGVIVIVCKLG